MIDAELRELDVPPDEVAAIVTADHPVIVHRYLELHRERLEERLADQLRVLERLERIITPANHEASHPGGSTPPGRWADFARGGRSGVKDEDARDGHRDKQPRGLT